MIYPFRHKKVLFSFILILSGCIQQVTKTKPSTKSESSLLGSEDPDSMSPLALKIRATGLAYVRKNVFDPSPNTGGDLYKLPTVQGELPELLKSVLLEILANQKGDLTSMADRPCFVDKSFISPAVIFAALQSAAAGKIPEDPQHDDKRLSNIPNILRGVSWRKLLNYNPETIPLLAVLEKWHQQLETRVDITTTSVGSSLGIKKIRFPTHEYKTAVFRLLKENELLSPDRTIDSFDSISCMTASQVRGLKVSNGYWENRSFIIPLFNNFYLFEDLRILYGFSASFPPSIHDLNAMFDTKTNIVGLQVDGIPHKDLEENLKLTVRQRIRHVIVSTSWLFKAGSGYLKRVFPNIDSVSVIDDTLPRLTPFTWKSEKIDGKSQIEMIDLLNKFLQELNLFGINRLRLQTAYAKIVLPRLEPLGGIRYLVMESQDHKQGGPCIPDSSSLEGIDIPHVARVFPRAQTVWIRSARVLETMGAYPYLKDTKIEWENLAFSSCIANGKNLQLKLPKEVFPRLKPAKAYGCTLDIEEKLDLSDMVYDPLAVLATKQ